jgi:hypothetical protein
MIRVLTDSNFDSAQEFVAELNKARLQNKKQWLTYRGSVAGKLVEIKTYGATYLQIFRIDGINQKLPCIDCTISEWKNAITRAVQS